MKLLIASNNAHKVREIKEILAGHFDEMVTMREAGWVSETMNFLYFDNPMRQMAPDIQVMATDTPDGGYRKFEETVLPIFDSIHTLEDAYRPFREYYLERREARLEQAPQYIDKQPFASMDFLD